MGKVMKEIKGIGPVISAGLLAHIDINKALTPGHIWRFAGYDPTASWGKGEKRPWNARLKVVCWKAGHQFVLASGGDNPSWYGLLIRERKTQEIRKNNALEFAEQVRSALAKKRFGAETEARKWYTKDMLPPGHIQARAERYAVKIFLSDIHLIWRWLALGEEPQRPWVIGQGAHTHWKLTPTISLVPELAAKCIALGATPWILSPLARPKPLQRGEGPPTQDEARDDE
jgi:hypothetical protein